MNKKTDTKKLAALKVSAEAANYPSSEEPSKGAPVKPVRRRRRKKKTKNLAQEKVKEIVNEKAKDIQVKKAEEQQWVAFACRMTPEQRANLKILEMREGLPAVQVINQLVEEAI